MCKENLIEKSRFLFASESIPIGDEANKTNTLKSWDEFKRFRHPFNSLIIIDNYYLDNEKDITKIVLLLKALLPGEISDGNTELDLTLVIYDNEIKTEESFEVKRKEFETKINSRLSLPYKIKTLIIRLSSKLQNHDRNILTNYLWFHSGHSIDYFKVASNVNYQNNTQSNVKETTSLFINGIASSSVGFSSGHNWNMYGYEQILSKAKNWYQERYKKTNFNRLLE